MNIAMLYNMGEGGGSGAIEGHLVTTGQLYPGPLLPTPGTATYTSMGKEKLPAPGFC